jgi:hypothetical protein
MATVTGHDDSPRGADHARDSADRGAPAAPVGELLVVIGPAGVARSSMVVALGGRLRGEERRRVAVARGFGAVLPGPDDRVDELLERAGEHAVGRVLGRTPLAPRRRYRELPAAEQLLLTVALALAGEPGTLLVDAADDGQDEHGGHRVWSGLRRLADSGTLVVAATAGGATAGGYAHRTVLLPQPAAADALGRPVRPGELTGRPGART